MKVALISLVFVSLLSCTKKQDYLCTCNNPADTLNGYAMRQPLPNTNERDAKRDCENMQYTATGIDYKCELSLNR